VIVVAWTPDANGERLFREFRDSAGD
jgi:hypothetical protein